MNSSGVTDKNHGNITERSETIAKHGNKVNDKFCPREKCDIIHNCNISKKLKKKIGKDNRFGVNKKVLYICSTSACRFTPEGLYP
jgi:hypothetical protein